MYKFIFGKNFFYDIHWGLGQNNNNNKQAKNRDYYDERHQLY